LEIFGSFWKLLETFGNPWKSLEVPDLMGVRGISMVCERVKLFATPMRRRRGRYGEMRRLKTPFRFSGVPSSALGPTSSTLNRERPDVKQFFCKRE
jgi:hypothetical protein